MADGMDASRVDISEAYSLLMLLLLLLQQIQVAVSANEGWFWHVTDIHYDFTYEGRQLTCQGHHVDADNRAYGDYRCDSPWALVNNTVHAMAEIKDDVDFLIWTGDTVGHINDADLSYELNAEILDNVTSAIANAFPEKQVYPTFGNHDYWPSSQYPPNNNDLYNETLDHRWNAWIGGAAQDENFRRGGYYTMVTDNGLRIVALNTNLYNTANKLVADIADPAGQFDWLNKILAQASADHEKVLLIAHIPPGVHTPGIHLWYHKTFNTRMVDILQSHLDVIVGMHFGHEHTDSFKILTDDAGSAGAPIFIAPAVTPRFNRNPAVRLIKYDRQTGKHLGYQQYYLDLAKTNQDGGAAWTLEYDTRTDYGLTELTAESMLKLTRTMKKAESQEFKNYWKYVTVSSAKPHACDENCHTAIVCGFTNFDMYNLRLCQLALVYERTHPKSTSR